jgi:hypothetical protein
MRGGVGGHPDESVRFHPNLMFTATAPNGPFRVTGRCRHTVKAGPVFPQFRKSRVRHRNYAWCQISDTRRADHEVLPT